MPIIGNICVDIIKHIEYTYISVHYSMWRSSRNLKIPFVVNNFLTLHKVDFLT